MAGSQTTEFGQGVDHATASGRANDQSITLGGSLQQDSDRWASLTPHAVLQSAAGGSPADTDMAVQWGQQAVGDQADTAMAGQSLNRMMQLRAASVGRDDNTA